jgi:2-polyprenyl-3-methyl-5-hydroxy-6-metoxy-1,4-benzoquinol methylase
MSAFKERLNENYVTTHFQGVRSPNADELESFARFYKSSLTSYLPTDKSVPVLDVGCGIGTLLYFLKREGYVNHWGIDIGPEQVEACRRHVTENVELVTDTASYLRARAGYYGAIAFTDVLEHLEDEELFPILDAARVALRPNGRVLVAVPNAACITTLVTRYADLTHRRLFTEHSLNQLLVSAGFDRVEIVPHEKKVVRSFGSRFERWTWQLRDRFARWLLSELHLHLMEGSYPSVRTVNLLGIATKD